MNSSKYKMQGGLSLTAVIIIIFLAIVAVYAFIDSQADSRAETAMMTVIEDAKLQGVILSYDTIDASPIARNVTLQNFKILGNAQEPDVLIGNLVISGLNWQDITNKQNHIPSSMSIDITDGKIIIDEEMIGNDEDLQSFVDVMGNELGFETHANYSLNEDSGLFTIALSQRVNDNFNISANLLLGNATWLTKLDADELAMSDNFTLDLLATTLNDLKITFKNEGVIEKMRAIAGQRSGLTNAQLTQQAVAQLRQVQTALKDYNPVYSLMVEELITFAQKPEQISITIDPEQPLVSDDFLKVFMGGQSAPFDLMKKAKLIVKAN